MTWYSSLGGESAGARAPPRPMAAHLLRWWRARFNNNYKHFSGSTPKPAPASPELCVSPYFRSRAKNFRTAESAPPRATANGVRVPFLDAECHSRTDVPLFIYMSNESADVCRGNARKARFANVNAERIAREISIKSRSIIRAKRLDKTTHKSKSARERWIEATRRNQKKGTHEKNNGRFKSAAESEISIYRFIAGGSRIRMQMRDGQEAAFGPREKRAPEARPRRATTHARKRCTFGLRNRRP